MPSNGHDGGDLRHALEMALEVRNIRLVDGSLSTFQTYDVDRHTVRFMGARTDAPYCIVHHTIEGRLFGNAPPREVAIPLSGVRHIGRAVATILHCGSFDAIRITYCGEEFGVVVDAGFLLERLRRIGR